MSSFSGYDFLIFIKCFTVEVSVFLQFSICFSGGLFFLSLLPKSYVAAKINCDNTESITSAIGANNDLLTKKYLKLCEEGVVIDWIR